MLFDQHNTEKLLSFTNYFLQEWLLLIGRFEFEQLFLYMDPIVTIYSTLPKLLTTTSENFVKRTIIIILKELHINCLLNDSI